MRMEAYEGTACLQVTEWEGVTEDDRIEVQGQVISSDRLESLGLVLRSSDRSSCTDDFIGASTDCALPRARTRV